MARRKTKQPEIITIGDRRVGVRGADGLIKYDPDVLDAIRADRERDMLSHIGRVLERQSPKAAALAHPARSHAKAKRPRTRS